MYKLLDNYDNLKSEKEIKKEWYVVKSSKINGI